MTQGGAPTPVISLYALAGNRMGPQKSRPGEGYDLYHDIVAAHLGRRRRALVERRPAGDVELSFEALHLRSTALSAAWRRAGIGPGQAICVALPVGAEYLAALLAGLRVGAVVSVLPPWGPTFVQSRLDALAAERVATSERYMWMLGRYAEMALPVEASPDEGPQPSHWYPPDAPVMRLLSPFVESPLPAEIPAALLHESLLRDGLFVFGLDASDTLAAPGFDPVQFQPHLALAALFRGAAWAELNPADLDADPRALARLGVTLLGIHRGLRDRVLREGAGLIGPACRAWFQSLTEVLDVDRWDALRSALASRRLPGFGVVACAAAGGAHLIGAPVPMAYASRVAPAPGRAWQLSEIAGVPLPALRATGVYTALRGGEPDPALPRLVLTRDGGELILAGAIDPGRDAQVYPAQEVARVAERHPAVRHAAVVVTPGSWPNDAHVALLVFYEDTAGPPPIPAVEALLAREMGARFSPDRIESFPLRPRLRDGVADGAYCRSQYLSGALHRKSGEELFVLLSRLRYGLSGAPPQRSANERRSLS